MLIGPKRAGKGNDCQNTDSAVGQGRGRSTRPSRASETNSVFQQLIGKKLAIATDARLGHWTDVHVMAERLLAISGEDAQTVNRKYQPH